MNYRDKTKVELKKELQKLHQEYDSLKTSYEKDITWHKRTEENLHKSAMKLARSQKIGKLGSWEWNIVENSLEWSDEMYRIWGVGKDFALTLESIDQMIHPDDREFNLKMIQKFLADTNNGEFEFRIICPDGTIKNIYQSIETSHAPSGQPLRMFGIMQDITGLKLAEEALYASEEKHRTLIEQSIDGIVISDEHGNVSVWNKSMESITGIQQCETIGRPLWEIQLRLIPVEQKTPELLGQLRNGLKNLLESKMEWTGESREQTIIDVNGTHKVVQDSSFMIKTNNKIYFGTIIRDITERILTEKALQKSEERFRSITEQITDVIFMTDTKGIIIYISPSARSVFGYSQEEMISMSFVTLLEKKNIPKAMDRFTFSVNNLSLMSGRKHENLVLLMKHKDGYAFTGELTSNPFFESEIVTGTIGVIRNISQRIQAEEEIRKSKELMENLNQHLVEIRENERALISREIHDQLGQSLTALKIDLMSLRAKMETESKETIVLGDMIKMVNTISRDVQRISSELRPLMLDDLGLAATLEWYCEEFAGRTGLKVELDIEAIQTGSIDKDLALYRVAQESLTNIIRHARAGMVQVCLHRINDNIVLTIQDDGIGISQDKKDSYKSMGLLGMSERVKQYDGKLEILAPDKNGTIIRASIPIN